MLSSLSSCDIKLVEKFGLGDRVEYNLVIVGIVAEGFKFVFIYFCVGADVGKPLS